MSLALLAVLLAPQEQETPVQAPKPPEKEVVVIGQRRESDILDVPSSVTVVTAEQIGRSGAVDIVQVLQKTPGFFAQGANQGAYDKLMDLRGYNNGAGNGQRTLVLVDGRKTNNVASSGTDWAAIPLENIERIEVVRGPAAAIYGDTAMAGVVNIVTKKGGKGTWSQVTAAAGNWDTVRASANLGGSHEKALYDVYAGFEGTDGWRDNSAYRGRNFTGRFEAPLAEGLAGFVKIGHHDDVRERPGTLTKAQIDALGRNASDKTGSKAEVGENSVDGGLEVQLGGAGTIGLFANYTRYEAEAFFVDFGGFFSDDRTDITLLQLKHVLRPQLLGREAAFTTGVDLSVEGAQAETQLVGFPEDESEYRRRLLGAYEHVEVRPAEGIILSGSLRYDRALLEIDRASPSGFADFVDDQEAFDQLSPHLGITWKALEELSAYASWGRTFRYPTRDELIGFLVTDPQLVPERSHTYEVGARYRSVAWGSASVAAYQMAVQDEIYFDPAAGTFGFGSNLNFDEVVHRGLELEARVTPVSPLEVFGTYTFTDVEIEDAQNVSLEGKTYPVTPRHSAAAGLSAAAAGATLTLSSRYIGERILISDFGNTAEELPDVVVYDAKLSYTWKSATAFVSVYNATNREYFDSAGFSSFGPIRYNPAPERSWLVGGELRF
jgi:iron complex outermembrane receptor protein